MDMLIIPDAHAHPDYDHNRFEHLGRFIVERRPDVIVCLGDFADMPSLSGYDRGTRRFEGRRYTRDIQAAHDANRALWRPVNKLNRRLSRNHKRKYAPRKIMVMGNHEDRIRRAVDSHSELEGHVSLDDLGYTDWWDEVVDFKDKIVVCGYTITHYFVSGVAGRPIGGVNPANTIVRNYMASCIAGHSHTLDVAVRTAADGRKRVGIVAGCYTHPRFIEDWNKDTVDMWWRGVIMLGGARNGSFDTIEAISMERLNEY